MSREESSAMVDRLQAHIHEHGFGFLASRIPRRNHLPASPAWPPQDFLHPRLAPEHPLRRHVLHHLRAADHSAG